MATLRQFGAIAPQLVPVYHVAAPALGVKKVCEKFHKEMIGECNYLKKRILRGYIMRRRFKNNHISEIWPDVCKRSRRYGT